MNLSTLLGSSPEWFGPFYALAFLASYITAAVIGYRRGWPPAAWLLVLAAIGVGGVVGTRLLPMGLDGLRSLFLDGELLEGTRSRIPGTIVGSLLAAEIARRMLGVRQSILEPLAYSGLAALAVVRVGCLIAGCCFGTPTDLPWGATYASGSFVHGYHLAHGIVASGATAPHPVHPIPLYDILFAVVLLALLPRISRRVQLSGNVTWLVVGLYAVHRFVQDFMRANETDVFAGLTAIQVGCAVAAVLTLGWVAFSERRTRQRPLATEGMIDSPPLARLLAVLAALLAIRVGLDGWLNGPEAVTLSVRLLPAAAAVAVVLWQRAAAPHLRWTATALAAGLPLVLGFQVLTPEADSTDRRFDLWAVEAHAGTGVYQEADVCDNDLYQYQTGGGGVAHVTVDLEKELTRELGLRVYSSTQQLTGVDETSPRFEQPGVTSYVANPYIQIEGANFGGHLGAQIGQVTYFDADESISILPTFGFRAGPRKFHLQGGVLDGPHSAGPAPAVHFGLGTGHLTEKGQEVRIQGGLSGVGLYLSGGLARDNFLMEPMLIYGGTLSDESAASAGRTTMYHVGLRMRYQIPSN